MEATVPGTSKSPTPERAGVGAPKVRLSRARKRRRLSSETSSDIEPVLPENTLEVEKNLQASAIKNNLDDVSVKKILKKVVTNDHVLALVKLREEEENRGAVATQDDNIEPKLTRAKVKKVLHLLKTGKPVGIGLYGHLATDTLPEIKIQSALFASKHKELMKVSPRAKLDVEKMALTPIKRIPVKTTPEVTALIDQELPEDEDDDEYEPTNDDVPSDDDHTLESCSDLDSQPRTPATPRSTTSPRVLRDGPFKVPQDVTPRRKLDMDEDATIALRTRSKLSLSSIPIDHIESSFVPPDELPMPVVDDVWTEFLQVCLNPEAEKEADDDDDPEYNVNADPDAHDEDEEGLENIMKISKKELNDLVTELFNVMPEGLGDEVLAGKLASEAPAQNSQHIAVSQWDGKQEPLSDDEAPQVVTVVSERRLTVGKSEPLSDTECQDSEKENQQNNKTPRPIAQPKPPSKVTVSVVESTINAYPATDEVVAPPSLQGLLHSQNTVTIQVEQGAKVLPEQIEILQQQLRQHVQLATSNFLQLFVHPVHWGMAPTYKEYLDTLTKITIDNPNSVANVCNLKPAWELINSWEKSVSEDTPENAKMVEFIQKEIERSRRRAAQNSLYVGDFHPTFLNVVANSPVFLYPHLLPHIPYRTDGNKRFSYMRCEDELIALGIDEFWQYVENNPELFKLKQANNNNHRWGLVATVELVCKHMMPWMPPRALLAHIQHVRKHKNKDADNPINRFFATREVTPVKHVLLPFNPKLTLYEQPEYEFPKIWLKYLSQNSRRFRDYLYRRTKLTGLPPVGVTVTLGTAVQPPTKKPLPINFTQKKTAVRLNSLPTPVEAETQDKFDVDVTPPIPVSSNLMFSVVQTPSGSYLIPISMQTNTVTSSATPLCSAEIKETVANNLPEASNVPTFSVTVPIRNYVPLQSDANDSEKAANKASEANSEPVTSEQVKLSEPSLPADVNVPNSKMLVITPLVNHCECCVFLRKKVKVRQSLITDFFRTPIETPCPCKERRTFKHPRISRKLKLLVNNYKCKPHRTLQVLISRAKELRKELMYGVKSSEEPGYTVEEIAAVTSFQLKLTIRASIARDHWMKRKINTLLSKFDPDLDNPCILVEQMENILNVECVDIYKEFLGFLTMEQADKIGKFLDYFMQECLEDLMKKVEELVPSKHHREIILSSIRRIFTEDPGLNEVACDLCTRILGACKRYPALAEYVFYLFPHRRDPKIKHKDHIQVLMPKKSAATEQSQNATDKNQRVDPVSTDNTEKDPPDRDIIEIETKATNNVGNETVPRTTDIIEESADPENTDNIEDEECNESQAMDYEADQSDSDDDGSRDNLTIIEDAEELDETQENSINESSSNVIDTPDLTVTKTEVQDCSESDMSTMVMSEDEIKTERPEWKRDEDKLLLKVLQQSLTPEEIKDKTILEIVEQKKVLRLAADNLPQKTLDDVRERILYLLKFLAMNEQ